MSDWTGHEKPKRCAGGFPSGYQCHNIAGCPHTPYWCFDCNEKRMAKISESMEDLLKRMTPGAQEKPDHFGGSHDANGSPV